MTQVPDTLTDRFLSGWSIGIASMDNAFGVSIALTGEGIVGSRGMHIDEAVMMMRVLSTVIGMAEQLNRERPD